MVLTYLHANYTLNTVIEMINEQITAKKFDETKKRGDNRICVDAIHVEYLWILTAI